MISETEIKKVHMNELDFDLDLMPGIDIDALLGNLPDLDLSLPEVELDFSEDPWDKEEMADITELLDFPSLDKMLEEMDSYPLDKMLKEMELHSPLLEEDWAMTGTSKEI